MPNRTSIFHPSQGVPEETVSRPVDFNFENHGSLCLLRPLTPAAVEWVNEHIGQDSGYQPMWPTVVIEPRCCDDIIEGLEVSGLTVRA